MTTMANHWAKVGDRVTLITLAATEADAYRVSLDVHRVAMDMMADSRGILSAIWNNWRRIRRLRRAILDSDPQAVISFGDQMNVLTLLACRGQHTDVIVSERIDPTRHDIGRLWSWLRRRTYPWCKALVVQTDKIRERVGDCFGATWVQVIPNPVAAPDAVTPEHRSSDSDKRLALGVGRLVPQKGFDLLIEAFSKVAADHADWDLAIFGEGAERGALEQLVRRKELTDRVRMPGWIDDPGNALREGDLFILSSRFEGFPNALLEAMAHGLAVIAFACHSGPEEIIYNGVDGMLVPPEDVDSLATAMDRLMSDAKARKRLGERASTIVGRLSSEKVLEQWNDLLSRIAER